MRVEAGCNCSLGSAACVRTANTSYTAVGQSSLAACVTSGIGARSDGSMASFHARHLRRSPNFDNPRKCCSAALASNFCNAAHRSRRLVHKRGAILAHHLSEARAAIRNLRLRLWDARPEWVDLEAAADHGGLGVVRLPCDSVHRGGLVQALHVAKLPVTKTSADTR